MRNHALLTIAFAATTLAACGGQGSADALVGTWTRLRDGSTEMRDRFTFSADGSMTFDENKPDARADEDHLTGTYTASDREVVATLANTGEAGHRRITFSYYANDSLFSPNALHPTGAHDGIVGTWVSSTKMENVDDPSQPVVGSTLTGEFRTDGSLHWSVTPHDGSAVRTYDGTWTAESTDTFRAAADGVSDSVIKLVDGRALVADGYVWQRD
jgi:hypothetical protein